MQIDAFRLRLDQFNEEFKIPMDIPSRAEKLTYEVCEYLESHHLNQREEEINEALDVLICAFQLCTSLGITNPLHFAAMKLDKNSTDYRNGKLVK